ncbi:neuronal membrane glycoprotein M6-a-like isoform X2 [Mytilus edulis]|uniref:neuronal membrane glycoprotein M6-a-like isoform X2 n=1 Tax=Mytilus edulis TaxID=6550 RepID=UPI0039EDEC0F
MMESPWESQRAEAENGELLSVEESDHEGERLVHKQPVEIVKIHEARNESFGNRVLHCLSQVPCASLIAWIILLVGLGGLTGGLLIGIQKTRDLVDSQHLVWFLEYAVAGVVAGMFVFGTLLLCIGHISTDPTSRHIFHTTKRNLCAQGLNITMLIFSYMFGIAWVLMTAIFGVPLYLLINILIIDVKEINLVNYGLHDKIFTGRDFENFRMEADRLLVIYITIFVSSILITVSMIHFLIVISSNLTHLKDTRLATLNAYADHTEMQNSKHSVVDTTM